MKKISDAKKAVAAALTGALGWATAVVTSAPDAITASEWVTLATVAVSSFLVWLLPNGEG